MLGVRHAARQARATALRPAQQIFARSYMDSIDLTNKLKDIDNTEDCLKFYHAHAGMDLGLLERTFRVAGRVTLKNDFKVLTDDARFCRMVSQLSQNLTDADSKMLVMLTGALLKFRTICRFTPLLQEFGAKVSEVILSRSRGFNPKQLAAISNSMSQLGTFGALAESQPKLVEEKNNKFV